MMLLKTEKARHELMPGVRTLSLRERSLLLLADGKPLQELQAMYHGLGRQMVDDLMRAGYFCAGTRSGKCPSDGCTARGAAAPCATALSGGHTHVPV